MLGLCNTARFNAIFHTNYDNFAFETLHSELTDAKRIQTRSRDDKTVYYDTGPGNARQIKSVAILETFLHRL